MENIMIGSRIKELRKARGMTQEQLAERVGISFQAVSKWENNIALPDITLVPKLAQIFGVSTDTLFAYDREKIREEIDQYVHRSWSLRETDPEEGRRVLEEGLQKYPENDLLLENLLYVLNYSEAPDETIGVASKLIEITTDSGIRYDALRFLAYAYHAKGETENAVAALEQIPELYFTKLSELTFVLSGRPKFEAAQKQKAVSIEILLQMMQKIAECYAADGEKGKAAQETERALALLRILSDGEDKNGYYSNYIAFFEKRLNALRTG